MSTHTPGPWKVGCWVERCKKPEHQFSHPGKRGDNPCVYERDYWMESPYAISQEETGQRIVSIAEDEPMKIADARLISAAPDLLTASKKAMSSMESIWRTAGHDDDWIYDEMGSELAAGYFSLRAAIAKATGEKA